MAAQTVAILQAIEERLTELREIQTDPEGRVQQSQNDTLRAYGLIAQAAEIMGIQREQILALADAIAVMVARFIEHDRKVATQHGAMLKLLEALAHNVGQADIAQAAEEARHVLHAAEEERLAEMEMGAAQAMELLSVARLDAIGEVREAVDRAEADIAAAAQHARETIAGETTDVTS